MPVRVKICGVRTPADLAACAAAGADAVGLNFYPRSPRYLDPSAAANLLAHLPPFIEPVGLFVETSLAEARARFLELGIRTVQWYGSAEEATPVAPCRLAAAFSVRDAGTLAEVVDFVARVRPAAVLADAFVPGRHGGTGRLAPWDLLAGFDPGVPLILAGGLTPDNVAEAVRRVRPYAVDVASGVERAPGQKDADKVRRFVAAVRAASS